MMTAYRNNPASTPLTLIKIPAGLLFFVISIVIAGCHDDIGDSETILTVNNEPVTKAEYLFIMSDLKPEVYSSFGKSLDGPEFWNGSFDGRVPAIILHQQTFQTLKRIKTEQALMKKYGIADDITFEGFLAGLEAENARRKEALEIHNPVYGPVEFEEKTYFKYLHSERIQRLKKRIANDSRVRQAEIDRMYDELRRTIDEGEQPVDTEELKAYIKMELAGREYDVIIDSLEKHSVVAVKIDERELRRLEEFIYE